MLTGDKPKLPNLHSADLDYVLDAIQSAFEGRRETPDRWKDLTKAVKDAALFKHTLPGEEYFKIGRFEALERIGLGGYGLVFEVRDPELGRHAALKLCLLDGDEAAATLKHEAQLLAKLSHPNIVTVYELGRHGEDVFFVMELVEGENGREFARRKPRPSWQHVVDVYIDAGRGLAAAHAHEQTIVHGDFKPSNILLDRDDRPRVSDFGLARLLREHQDAPPELGSPKVQPGTLYYMSPEVLRGEFGGPKADQWSFCVALWETLEGRRPFMDCISIDDMLIAATIFDPEVGHRDVPERVRAVLRRGLSVIPHERYPSMDALLDDLADTRQEVKPEPRAGWASFAVALMLVGAMAFAVLSISRAGSSTPPPDKKTDEAAKRTTSEPPCKAEGAPFTPDAGVVAVCRSLRSDSYTVAHPIWDELFTSRMKAVRSHAEWLDLASDTAVIARTFLDEAKSPRHDKQTAHALVLKARYFATKAQRLVDEPPPELAADDGLSSTAAQIQSIIDEVMGTEMRGSQSR